MGLGWSSLGGSGTVASVVGKSSDVSLIFYQNGDGGAKRNILGTFREQKLSDVAFFLHFEVNSCFVGFNAGKDIAGRNFISNFEVPGANVTL